jgi:hypothetical protein
MTKSLKEQTAIKKQETIIDMVLAKKPVPRETMKDYLDNYEAYAPKLLKNIEVLVNKAKKEYYYDVLQDLSSAIKHTELTPLASPKVFDDYVNILSKVMINPELSEGELHEICNIYNSSISLKKEYYTAAVKNLKTQIMNEYEQPASKQMFDNYKSAVDALTNNCTLTKEESDGILKSDFLQNMNTQKHSMYTSFVSGSGVKAIEDTLSTNRTIINGLHGSTPAEIREIEKLRSDLSRMYNAEIRKVIEHDIKTNECVEVARQFVPALGKSDAQNQNQDGISPDRETRVAKNNTNGPKTDGCTMM